MKKHIFKILTITLLLTGCIKKEKLEHINILTTTYPIEYITESLYKDNSTIKSIYADGENIFKAKFTKKQIEDFSKSGLYIYIGQIEEESKLAVELKKLNKNLLLIDAGKNIDIQSGIEELWLDQSNMLMVSQNIADGLKEYIQSQYLKNKVDTNFKTLNLEISNIDAEMKKIANNAIDKTIVVNTNTLKFLNRYGFEVISLDEKEAGDHTIERIKTLNYNKYIYYLKDSKESIYAQELLKDKNYNKVVLNNISNITDEERENKTKFPEMINKFMESIMKDTY